MATDMGWKNGVKSKRWEGQGKYEWGITEKDET
jgi:hypothetical protein